MTALKFPVQARNGELPESGEDSVASSSAASDSESVAESLDSMEAGYSGPWFLNMLSGIKHRAIRNDAGDWGLACRPRARLHSGYAI